MEETSNSETAAAPSGSNKAAQCSVISIYQAKIVDVYHSVTVVWSKNLINHSLAVTADKYTASDGASFAFKTDLKPWPFWSKKGSKTFEVDGRRVDLFWDLRSAKFSAGPEPLGGYYVALVCDEEVILLVGDCKKEAYKKTRSRPSLEDAVLVAKKENIFGKKSFTARTRFDERGKEHEIVVENSISSPKDPEMWIRIDGVVLIHVSNLQWKFRGNETVLVEQVPVQIFWDVHDWLFSSSGSGHALFIFKPGATQISEDQQNSQREMGEGLVVQRNSEGCPSFVSFFMLGRWSEEHGNYI